MKLRNVLFDLDGTLVDSKLDIARSQVVALRAQGFCCEECDLLPLAGQPLHIAFRNVRPDLRDEPLARMIAAYRDHYWDHALDTTVLCDGVAEMLERLAAASVGIAVATTKGLAQAQKVVAGVGLDRWVRHVFGTDPPLRYKPAPDLFVHATGRCGWSTEETLAIGDAPADVAAAHASGCVPGAALWDAHDRERVLEERPLFCFDRPDEVCRAVLGEPVPGGLA